MTIELEQISVWQALSLLGMSRDGTPMSEERARRALRDIGMKEEEMNAPYPEEAMDELEHLINNPKCLDKTVEVASKWMLSRN
jgi:hypothetical protein